MENSYKFGKIRRVDSFSYRFIANMRYNAGMCGAYGFSVNDARDVYNRLDIQNTLTDFKPRWNIRPGQMKPVVTRSSPNKIQRMFWGLIPHFAQDKNYKYKTINATAETLAEKPTFRGPLRDRRCLVPANFFYEPDKINFAKPPFPWHCFRLRNQEMFGLAGLYDIWKDKHSDLQIVSYAIITTTPNSVVGKYHDRMPVILSREDEETWFNPDVVEPEHLLPLLKPYPDGEMDEWLVSGEARNPRNDFPGVCKPVK